MTVFEPDFLRDGWCRFGFDAVLADWVRQTLPVARGCVADPAHAQWLRCAGTWFAGVNVLPNDAEGRVQGGPPLAGDAVKYIHNALGLTGFAWDKAQVSVCYPGYPQPMPGETDAAYGYRLRRDAAHVDGLRRVGPEQRRFLNEYHGFILGIPLADTSEDASPFVIWQGSHEIVRGAMRRALDRVAPEAWGDIDMTETYHAVRREIFNSCQRIEVAAKPGEAYLVHRLALHGVAPWGSTARAGKDGRMIAYFRPETGGPAEWLNAR